MKKQKIYIETTIFNYFFEPERDAYPYTVKLFEEIKNGKYDAFTSVYVVGELSDAPEPKRSSMLALIKQHDIAILDFSQEAVDLGAVYVKENIIPHKYSTDSFHIAIAVVNELDMIISLNFKHIVKKATIDRVNLVNNAEHYKPIQIYTPMEVVDYE